MNFFVYTGPFLIWVMRKENLIQLLWKALLPDILFCSQKKTQVEYQQAMKKRDLKLYKLFKCQRIFEYFFSSDKYIYYSKSLWSLSTCHRNRIMFDKYFFVLNVCLVVKLIQCWQRHLVGNLTIWLPWQEQDFSSTWQ